MAVFFYWSGQEFDFANYLAVASAAVHFTGDVVVLVDDMPRDNPHFERLRSLPRVRVRALVLDEWLSAEQADLYRRMRFVAHRSDLVRFAVLARVGGLYLDTDTLTVSDLDDVPPRLLLRDEKIVHVGTMALPAGDPLAEEMLRSMVGMSDHDLDVYQSIVHRWTDVVRGSRDPVAFSELEAYFPVRWQEWESIFAPDGFTGDRDSIRVLHHWGYFSTRYTARMAENWIAENACLFSSLAAPVLRAVATVTAGYTGASPVRSSE